MSTTTTFVFAGIFADRVEGPVVEAALALIRVGEDLRSQGRWHAATPAHGAHHAAREHLTLHEQASWLTGDAFIHHHRGLGQS